MDSEKRDREKTLIQDEAERLSTIHKNVVLQWATGCGKTLAVLRMIDKDTSDIPWLILTPEQAQADNMKREISKQSYGYLLGTKVLDIICYASFKKHTGQKVNLVFNECHRLSELREDIAQTVKFERFFADSATIPKSVKERLGRLGSYYEYQITLREAIDKGILPEPAIHLIEIEPNDKLKRNPYKFGKREIMLTDAELVDKLDSSVAYWRQKMEELDLEGKDSEFARIKMIQAGSMRKRKLAWLKNDRLIKLIEELGHTRFICFTGSIEQCTKVGGKNVVHSKKARDHNRKKIDQFNNFEISQIFLNQMGREGMNMMGVEAVILVQVGTGADEGRDFIQTTGRALRADYPHVYILCIKNSADERFVKKALSHIKA